MPLSLTTTARTHPLYDLRRAEWERCRDCYDGVDAVRRRGAGYLPKLHSRQTPAQYRAYAVRANFFGAYARTVEGLVGLALRHAPTVEAPARVLADLADADGQGTSIEAMIEQAVRELLITGRAVLSQDIRDGRVMWSAHRAEDLLSWQAAMDGGRRRMTVAVITRRTFTGVSPVSTDVSEWESWLTWRHDPDTMEMTLSEQRRHGSTIWETRTEAAEAEETQTAPLMGPGGRPLSRLPVTVIDLPAPPGILLLPPKPPMLDLADMSLALYRDSADLQHGLHYVALPTAWITSRKQPNSVTLGSGQVIWLPRDGAAGMLEVAGPGFAALREAMADKRRQMSAVGARLVDEPTRHAETATAVSMKAGGDRSILHTVCHAAEAGVRDAIALHMEWMGITGPPPVVRIHRDFVEQRLAPEDVMVLAGMLQTGTITQAAFAEALVRGEWIRTADQVPEDAGASIPGVIPAAGLPPPDDTPA